MGGVSDGIKDTVAYDLISGAKEWTATYGTPGAGLAAASTAATRTTQSCSWAATALANSTA